MPKAEDSCWEDVEREFNAGKHHPKVICKYCRDEWTSKDKRRLEGHMRGCPNLPERLWLRYQPEKAGLPPLPPATNPRQRQEHTPAQTQPQAQQNLELWASEPPWMWANQPSSANPADTPTNGGPVDDQTNSILPTPSKKRRRDSPDADASLKRLASHGKGSHSWRYDTDIVVDEYLSVPSATELAPVRRAISQLGREAQYAGDAMSSIRYAWHTKQAEGLGEMIMFEADAVRVVANLLRVAEERQLKGFGRRVLRQVEAYLPAEGEPEAPA